jgi:hypothetical protein
LNGVFQKLDRIAGTIHQMPYLSQFTFRLARTRREFESALSLVQKEYFRKKYSTDTEEVIRLTPFHLLSETIVITALCHDKVVATLSLIFDSRFGLPMDKLFHTELSPYRESDASICEASTFAINSDFFESDSLSFFDPERLSFVLTFYKIAVFYAKYIMGTEFVFVTIHPRHNLMYDFLTFSDLSDDVKKYGFVNDAPAKAKVLDLKNLAKNCQERNQLGLFRMFFENHFSLENFMYSYTMDSSDVEYFLSKCNDSFCNSPEVRSILEEHYPEQVSVLV